MHSDNTKKVMNNVKCENISYNLGFFSLFQEKKLWMNVAFLYGMNWLPDMMAEQIARTFY